MRNVDVMFTFGAGQGHRRPRAARGNWYPQCYFNNNIIVQREDTAVGIWIVGDSSCNDYSIIKYVLSLNFDH